MRCTLSLVLLALLVLAAAWRVPAELTPALPSLAVPVPVPVPVPARGPGEAATLRTTIDAALSGDVASPASLRAYVAACEGAGPEALQQLRELARRYDPLVASHALRALGRVSGGGDPALTMHLADARPAVRQAAIDGLGVAGNEGALTILEPLARDPDPTVRHVAIAAMGRIGGARAVERLVHLAESVTDPVDLAFLRAALDPPAALPVHRDSRDARGGSTRRTPLPGS